MAKARGVRKADRAESRIVVIGGGSLGWTPVLLADLALNNQLGGTIVLHDIDPVPLKLTKQLGTAIMAHRQAGGRFKIEATTNRREALKGADFVIVTISVGGMAMMRHDVDIPATFGVLQTVGDTVGPGGIMRGLRNVPVFASLAEQILRYCPDAWVLNYTNPMSTCTWTLAHHGCKAVGCCHEVFGSLNKIAKLANEHLGRKDLTRQDVDAVVTGINHCTFFTRARVAGLDGLQLLRDHMAEPGVLDPGTPEALANASVFGSKDLVAFDLFTRYGAFGAAGDRHLAEFFPGFITDKTHAGNRWGIKLTPIDWRIGAIRDRVKTVRGKVRDKSWLRKPLTWSGEEAAHMIQALAGHGDFVTNVNTLNQGQIPNLPGGSIVETNALLSADRVSPINAGPLPRGLLGALFPHVINHGLIVEAGLTGDCDLALQAFLNDPLVGDRDDAVKMFEQMLKAEADYLPNFFARRKVRKARRDSKKLAAIDGALAAGLPVT